MIFRKTFRKISFFFPQLVASDTKGIADKATEIIKFQDVIFCEIRVWLMLLPLLHPHSQYLRDAFKGEKKKKWLVIIVHNSIAI